MLYAKVGLVLGEALQRLSCDDGGLGDCLHVGTLIGFKRSLQYRLGPAAPKSAIRLSTKALFSPLKILHLKMGHKIYT